MEALEEMPTDFDRVLAVVAHPDDLESSATAAIAVWTDSGKTVSYLLVTRGEAGIHDLNPIECAAVREREEIAAAKKVGVDTVDFLDRADGSIEYSLDLRRDIAAAIRRHRPELVVTLNHHDTWGGTTWNTPDHRNTGRAVLDAIGDAGNRWIFPDLTQAGLEPWDGVRWVAIAGSPYPTHAIAVEAGLERSIASLQAHAAYNAGLGQSPDDIRTFLTANANAHSDRFAGRQATAFELVSFH